MVFNAIHLTDSELDYGIGLWVTVILGDIFRYRLLLLFCTISYTLMYIIFIIHNLHIILSMNGIVRHIVINHLSRFIIMFVIHISSSHNITSTQSYLYDTFNIVATTHCLILIYQLFLQLFNIFVTYIHINAMPTLYKDLHVIMFVLLHLYCMYFCPSWQSIFSIAILHVDGEIPKASNSKFFLNHFFIEINT